MPWAHPPEFPCWGRWMARDSARDPFLGCPGGSMPHISRLQENFLP